MQYDDLTTEQKAQLQDWLNLLRPAIGEAARAMQHLSVILAAHATGPDVIAASLDAGAVLPNTGGLAGATAVTVEELDMVLTDIGSVLGAQFDAASLPVYIKFAGAANILG